MKTMTKQDMLEHHNQKHDLPIHGWCKFCMKEFKDIKQRAVEWALSDDTGISSKCLAKHMLGIETSTKWFHQAPLDAGDRGRCIRLLNKIPEWWRRLNEMNRYDGWKEQIELIRLEANQ